jgi:hypothetical protein
MDHRLAVSQDDLGDTDPMGSIAIQSGIRPDGELPALSPPGGPRGKAAHEDADRH